MSLVLFLSGFIGTSILIPFFKNMLVSSNLVRPNYKGEQIPVGMGIIFLPMLIINSIFVLFITKSNIAYIYMFLFGIMSMFFAGIIDDTIGNRDVSGLGGHFRSLLKGNLTTGGFKALFGGFVGLMISVTVSRNIIEIIVNTLVIALSTNLMNLLDLRPGRAIKVYLVIMIGFFLGAKDGVKDIINSKMEIRNMVMLMFPNVLSYFRSDLKAKSMMGDTGSNVLGISIGIIFVIWFSYKARVLWLLFLIFMHILTEKYSLTKIIENNKFLNKLDKLGR